MAGQMNGRPNIDCYTASCSVKVSKKKKVKTSVVNSKI